MNCISELNEILKQHFIWNKARLDCFTRMLLALFVARTVNLRELAVAMNSSAMVSSRYMRLKRFFWEHRFNYDLIAKLIFNWFFQGKKIYITIDRTNWYLGKSKINVLMLAVAYEGVAIPLFWCLLNKAGNATAGEHRAILARFIRVFGTDCIAGVLGDREFASGKLFNYLNKHNIPFYIRIKDNSQAYIKRKKFCKVKAIFSHLHLKEKTEFQMSVWLYDQKVFLAGSRSERGELMVIATNQLPATAVAIYLRRWEIETLFSCLKSRGFRFEDTRITKRDRLKKLIALLAVGFCWAHKTGEWRAKKKPIRLCQHRTGGIRPQHSYFRYGLDFIRDIVINPTKKLTKFRQCLALLLPNQPLMEVMP